MRAFADTTRGFAYAHGMSGPSPSLRRRQQAFTLLELMMVVAFIAILGAFAIPAVQGYVQRANVSAALADIGSLSLALKTWETNNGTFPDTLAEAGLAGRQDPWGNAYQYVNVATANVGQLRKNKNLVPINTDFDLYSMGADGRTVAPLTAAFSRDDIVRANNGGFIGLGEDY